MNQSVTQSTYPSSYPSIRCIKRSDKMIKHKNYCSGRGAFGKAHQDRFSARSMRNAWELEKCRRKRKIEEGNAATAEGCPKYRQLTRAGRAKATMSRSNSKKIAFLKYRTECCWHHSCRKKEGRKGNLPVSHALLLSFRLSPYLSLSLSHTIRSRLSTKRTTRATR